MVQGGPPHAGHPSPANPDHSIIVGAPQPPPPVPADANYTLLENVPQIHIRQQVDWAELLIDGLEIANTYHMFLSAKDQEEDRKWMAATEHSKCCARTFWNPRHKLDIKVGFPNGGPTILEGERPCICCLNRMTVKVPGTGQVLGTFEQDCKDLWCCCGSTMHAKDAGGNHMFDMEGPSPCTLLWCMSCPCRDPFEFKQVANGKPTGATVQNVPNGCAKMCFTDADDYILNFAEKSTAEAKAMLLMYTFLLDYQFFQAKHRRSDDSS
jgi:hypothetical protein